MLKNINFIEIRSLDELNTKFVQLHIIPGSGTITIEGTKETSGRLTTIAIEAKLSRYIDSITKPLSIHVQWHDDDIAKDRPHLPNQGVVFGSEFLPAYIEYEDDEILKITVKYQTPLSFDDMCCINMPSFLYGR